MSRALRPAFVLAVSATLAMSLAGCAEDAPAPAGTPAPGATTDDSAAPTTDAGPIKMGVILDITGAGASLGVPERQTIEMLAKKLNDAGGINGRQVELLIEDNQSTEDAAAKAATKLITQENIDILLGASRTGPSLAMRPIAEANKIPMISLAANAKIVDGSKWVFKTAQNDRVVIENIVDLAKEKGWHKVALLRDGSAFGEGVAEMIDELGKEAGVSVVATEKFAPDASDFTAQMVNLRNTDADVTLLWGIPPAAALAQKAYVQLGPKIPVIQSHGIGNQVFLDTAGASADGLLAPLGRLLVADQLPDGDPQKEILTEFISDYEKAYNSSPSTFAGHAYDGFQVAVEGLKKAGTEPEALRTAIEGIQGLVGISGVFNMTPEDHSGLDKTALAIVSIEDGKWKLVDANRD